MMDLAGQAKSRNKRVDNQVCAGQASGSWAKGWLFTPACCKCCDNVIVSAICKHLRLISQRF